MVCEWIHRGHEQPLQLSFPRDTIQYDSGRIYYNGPCSKYGGMRRHVVGRQTDCPTPAIPAYRGESIAGHSATRVLSLVPRRGGSESKQDLYLVYGRPVAADEERERDFL